MTQSHAPRSQATPTPTAAPTTTLVQRAALPDEASMETWGAGAAPVAGAPLRASVALRGASGAAAEAIQQRSRAVQLYEAEGGITTTPRRSVQRLAVQQEKVEKAKKLGDTVRAAALSTTIATALVGVDQGLMTGGTVRLKVVSARDFELAWAAYCDRSGTPGAKHEESMKGFVDPTYEGGAMGFVLQGSGEGTLVHEALHQKANATFVGACQGWMNEGTTELITRFVLGTMGSTEVRTAYADAHRAVAQLQAKCGLAAIAKWYFNGDRTGVDGKVGASKVNRFVAALAQSQADAAIAEL